MNEAPIEPNEVPSAPSEQTADVIVEDFATVVEREAMNQLASIKMAHDQSRKNKAVEARVAELVAEAGLPPKQTDEQMIETLVESFRDAFRGEWIKRQAHEQARALFFADYPAAVLTEREDARRREKRSRR